MSIDSEDDDTRQTVLVADDEQLNRKVLTDILKADYRVILAKNGAQAIEKAAVHQPDLILLDIIMPDHDGYDVLYKLKARSSTQSIPVIFISALDTEAHEEKGLLLGASDYISKPFRPTLVKARVDNHMQMVRQRKLLEELANLDGLTNIANRRCFENCLAKEWGRAKRNRTPLSLAMIDVDHFKQYNDNYGHGGGDMVLRTVAKALKHALKRPSDKVARYGGEEFVILLPDTDEKGAFELMKALRQAIQALEVAHAFSPTSPVLTISIGGATLTPGEHVEPIALVNRADEALYCAKEAGRNQVIWAGLATSGA
ncbi:MAG: diguanylate cyclase [Hahellaceae bacterium]|nr:diguanylate cyclase [Hahellaceae bacterium]MCP5168198.1 diguanylate cyclase [Hahellaceae bacterium]